MTRAGTRVCRSGVAWIAAAVVATTVWAAAPALRIADAWMRPAFAKGGTTAGYLRFENTSAMPATVVRVTSPVASAVELHRVRHEGDVMRMEMLETLTVPAHDRIVLAPNGLHLMFIGVTRPLAAGERVPVHFVLADGSTVDAVLTVRADGESR